MVIHKEKTCGPFLRSQQVFLIGQTIALCNYCEATTRNSSAAATVTPAVVQLQLKPEVLLQAKYEPVVTRRIFTLVAAAFKVNVTLSMLDGVVVFRLYTTEETV